MRLKTTKDYAEASR